MSEDVQALVARLPEDADASVGDYHAEAFVDDLRDAADAIERLTAERDAAEQGDVFIEERDAWRTVAHKAEADRDAQVREALVWALNQMDVPESERPTFNAWVEKQVAEYLATRQPKEPA